MTQRTCTVCSVALTGRQTKYCGQRCATTAAHVARVARGYLEEKRATEMAQRDLVRPTCSVCGKSLRYARVARPTCNGCVVGAKKARRLARPGNAPVQTTITLDKRGWLRRAYEEQEWSEVIRAIRASCSVTQDGCWLWSRQTHRGYPVVQVGTQRLQVHRLSLEAKHGRPLGSQPAHHVCAQTTCVNPAHLQPITHRENTAEMLARHTYLRRIRELEEALETVAPSHPLLHLVSVA